jgi:hypothetical protein
MSHITHVAVYHGIIPLPVERSSVSGDANITESWIRYKELERPKQRKSNRSMRPVVFQTELLGSTLYRKFKTYIPVLRERTFGSTTGVKTRAGN